MAQINRQFVPGVATEAHRIETGVTTHQLDISTGLVLGSETPNFRFDLTVLSRILGFSVVAPLGRGAAARRGGTSWELEGTSPRLFMRGRGLNRRLADIIVTIAALFSTFMLTVLQGGFRIEGLGEVVPIVMSGSFACVFILFFSVFYSERSHECQIGSGEGIRTAVRQTFLS